MLQELQINQLRSFAAVQEELMGAIQSQQWETAAIIAPTLRDIAEAYHYLSGSNSPGTQQRSQSFGGSSWGKTPQQRLALAKPKQTIPSSYSYPDGFQGVELPMQGEEREDAWADRD